MSVEELSTLHQRYVELSGRFKSAWTFHQFLQGLHKLLLDADFAQHSADFQAVYGLLKEVSQDLTASAASKVRNELDMVERRLAELNRVLLQEDSKLSPSLLRLFFQRVRNYDDSIIVQLVRFYLYQYGQVEWNEDRNDKVDFLITKVAEEAQGPKGPWVLHNRSHVRQTFAGFWKILWEEPDDVPEDVVEMHVEEIETLRDELTGVDSFDDLIAKELVNQFREFKHGLGNLFFHPDVLLALVETNLQLRNHIQSLYRREEQKIVADYQRIFDLEQQVPVDTDLDTELTAFRGEVEKFEKSLQNETLSLEELGRLREHVRSLVPKLTGMREGQELFTDQPDFAFADEDDGSEKRAGKARRDLGWSRETVAKHYDRLVAAMEEADDGGDPQKIVYSPILFGHRIETRELEAFRRLASDDADGDPSIESFILHAAAVRNKAHEEVEEIQSILDDTAVTQNAPVYARARKTTKLADLFVRRFEHEMENAIVEGRAGDARDLQFLKMRLVRDTAGLWLLVHKHSRGS